MAEGQLSEDQMLAIVRRIMNKEPQVRELLPGAVANPGHPEPAITSTPRISREYEEPPQISGPYEPLQSQMGQNWLDDLITFDEDPSRPQQRPRAPPRRPIQEATQTGPSTETILREFTSQIGELLQRFTEVSRQPHDKIQSMDTYTGRVEEDPHQFVETINLYITKNQIHGNADRNAVFKGQLRGEAKEWVQSIKYMPLDYSTLCDRFCDEFDSPRRQVEAYSRFYAEHQKDGESAEAFITLKQALLRRLRPNMGVATTVEMVISLLRPSIASRIVGNRPEGLEELVRQVRRIEPEVAREYAALERMDVKNPIAKPRSGPSTPCRWCAGWHYNNQCPRQPDPASRNQDFSRGGAAASTTVPKTASSAPRPPQTRDEVMRRQEDRRVRWQDQQQLRPQSQGPPNNRAPSPQRSTT